LTRHLQKFSAANGAMDESLRENPETQEG